MSAKATGTIWDMDITAPQRMVLLAMADHADHHGDHIYAPIPFIAWKTGYSPRNTARIVQDLIDAGLLIVTKAGLGESNEYRFDFTQSKLKQPYKGRKPKKPMPTHDKMAGVKSRTHDKMAWVGNEMSPTHDKMTCPPDKMAGGTHDNMAIDHDQYHLESDHDSPPPTNPRSTGGGGGDFDREIANLFRDYHIGQYRKLARLYRATYPDVTIDQLRLACEQRFDRTIPATLAGGRLYTALQDGLPGPLPVVAPASLPPAYSAARPERPTTVLTAAERAAIARKIEQERHAATNKPPPGS